MGSQTKPVIYAWIFARGGSKGLPRKNILPLDGRPLIAHAIEIGLQSELIDTVFVSTDNDEIAEIARMHGATVPFIRPNDFATDQAPERLAWRHAVEWVRASNLPNMDVMVSLPATSPLRTLSEVNEGIDMFLSGEWDTVISVSHSCRHPSFNMVNIENDGSVELVNPPDQTMARRQDFKPIYDISTAFYVTAPNFVMSTDSFWDGRVGAVEIPSEHAVDIDTDLDFKFTEFLLDLRQHK